MHPSVIFMEFALWVYCWLVHPSPWLAHCPVLWAVAPELSSDSVDIKFKAVSSAVICFSLTCFASRLALVGWVEHLKIHLKIQVLNLVNLWLPITKEKSHTHSFVMNHSKHMHVKIIVCLCFQAVCIRCTQNIMLRIRFDPQHTSYILYICTYILYTNVRVNAKTFQIYKPNVHTES